MISAKLACITIILCAISNTALCIECHKCSSRDNPLCVDAADNSTLEECPEKFFCRKTIQIIVDEDMTRITRDCGWIPFEKHPGDYCMVSNSNFKKEISCQCFKDGCNVGPRSMPTIFSTVVFLIITLSGY